MVGDTAENQRVEVSEQSTEAEQPFTLMNTETILLQLQSVYQGTDQGFIDFLKRINLDELDLERLKRSDLSGAGFSFESVYQDLLVVHSMLRETLTSSHEWMLHFPRGVARDVVNHLQQFYAKIQEIEGFEISDDNPKQTHDNLLQGISNVCDSAKEPLGRIVAYLSSRKVGQLTAEVDDTVAKLKTETNRVEEINSEAEQKQVEREQEFDRLKLEVQNQLTEKTEFHNTKQFSQIKQNEYRKGSSVLACGYRLGQLLCFLVLFTYWLSTLLESGGPQMDWNLAKSLCKGVSAFSDLLVA